MTLADLAVRAGGGHSFSGGGASSSGGGGGGGGFFFFGGGGGGGGGGIAGFIVLIVIVLLVLGIYMAVKRSGRTMGGAIGAATRGFGGPSTSATPAPWSGTEGPAIDTIRGDLFPGTHTDAHAAVSPVEQGLAEIQAHDPAFNQESFLESVQKAFFIVQEAWEQRKPDMSRQVMADGIWQQHKAQIEGYLNEHKRNVLEDLAVGDLRILSAHSDQTYDTITVRIFAACADYDVDDEKGKIIRGNRSVGQWQEDWTFQRSSSATTKPGAGTLNSKCPNCGAPLNVDLQGVCSFCHQPIMGGKYDWVLARIAQVM
ncbi:MAG TPA: Tim44-like domain-containing protein [Acidimicrobiales bacterium]|jgi:predicted lipid-binding transport protein (Tim44 family)|nr:Tim44-like domain-containing protein [Acidimicrobiales bacterium]